MNSENESECPSQSDSFRRKRSNIQYSSIKRSCSTPIQVNYIIYTQYIYTLNVNDVLEKSIVIL